MGNTFGTVPKAQRDAPWVDEERRPKAPEQAHRGWNGLQTFQGQGFPRRSARKWRILTHGHIVPGTRRPAESPHPVGDGCALALGLWVFSRWGWWCVSLRFGYHAAMHQQPIVILGGWVGSLLTGNYQRQRARQPNKWRANGRAETPCPRGWVPEGTATKCGVHAPRGRRQGGGDILPPKAGRPTYGNAPPLRGLGIDRPGMIGVAIARERVGGGRLPCGRMPRQGRRSRRPPAPGGWRDMPRGLESEDIGEGVGGCSGDGVAWVVDMMIVDCVISTPVILNGGHIYEKSGTISLILHRLFRGL